MATEEFGWGDIPNFTALVERIEFLTEEIAKLIEWKASVENSMVASGIIPVMHVAQFRPRNRRQFDE